jgi:hypothetical protein
MEHGVCGSGGGWTNCSASSHGPRRKLTYVSTSVKRNVVNMNVYKTEAAVGFQTSVG